MLSNSAKFETVTFKHKEKTLKFLPTVFSVKKNIKWTFGFYNVLQNSKKCKRGSQEYILNNKKNRKQAKKEREKEEKKILSTVS